MKKYQYVARNIAAYIQDKNMQHGDKLPKVTMLMQLFHVGKSAVLQALSLLDQQGVIYKVQGSGIFVRSSLTERKNYLSLVGNGGFTESLGNIETSLLRFDLLPEPPEWVKNKGLPAGPCYEIVRLREKDRQKYVLETSYYTKSIIPYLSEEIARGSIFSYIKQGLNKEVRFSDKYMDVRKLHKREADILGLKSGDPTLEVKEVFYLSDGQTFDVSQLIYNYKVAKFFDQSADELI